MVYEGGSPGLINIKSYVPPSLFCPAEKRDGCEVRLYAGVRAAEEKQCPDLRVIPQAVVAWTGAPTEAAFCGISVASENWQQTHVISIKGVVDALKDGDQQRTVEVWARVTSERITTDITHSLGQVKVSTSLQICTVLQGWMHGFHFLAGTCCLGSQDVWVC